MTKRILMVLLAIAMVACFFHMSVYAVGEEIPTKPTSNVTIQFAENNGLTESKALSAAPADDSSPEQPGPNTQTQSLGLASGSLAITESGDTQGNVAMVNNEGYKTFEEAITAWKEKGGTLKLLADVDDSSISINDIYCIHVVTGQQMTLDLNGHKLIVRANGSCNVDGSNATHYIRVAGGTFTITDTSAEMDGVFSYTYGGNSAAYLVEVVSGTMNMSAGTLTNESTLNYGGCAVYTRANGTFNMTGGTIATVRGQGSRRVNPIYNNGGITTLNGALIDSEYTITNANNGTMTIADTTHNGAPIKDATYNCVAIVTDGKKTWTDNTVPTEFTAAVTSADDVTIYYTYEGAAADRIKNAANGDYIIIRENAAVTTSVKPDGFKVTVKAENGATYNGIVITPAAYCETLITDNADVTKTYTVAITESSALAKAEDVNGNITYCNNISSAVKAAGNDGKVTMLADYTSTSGLTISNSVTLDLNGKSISIAYGHATNYRGALMVKSTTEAVTLIIVDSMGRGSVENTKNTDTVTGYALLVDGNEDNKIVVEAGIYIGPIMAANGSIEISGGIFDAPVEKKYCAEGYIPIDRGNGSYSVYSEPKVATVTIGDVTSDKMSLSAAFAVAKANPDANATIKLTENVELPYWTSVDMSGVAFTLNGNSKTITGLTQPLIQQVGGKDVTIKSLTIRDSNIVGPTEFTGNCATGALIGWVNEGTNVTISSCKVIDSTLTETRDSYAGGLIGYTAGGATVKISSPKVTGCTISAVSSAGGFIGHSNGGVTITNGTVGGNTITAVNNNANVGSVIGTLNGAGDSKIAVTESSASINGVTNTTAYVVGGRNAAVHYTAGTYYTDPGLTEPGEGAVTADGLIVKKGEVWIIAKVTAKVGEGEVEYFNKLSEAVKAANAATEATTITLLTDVSDSTRVTINAGKTVTLDLGGHTWKSSGSMSGFGPLTNKGDLTIKNGTIISTTMGGACGVVTNYDASATLIIAADATLKRIHSDANLTFYGLKNVKGTATVYGTIDADGHGIYAAGTVIVEEGAKVTSDTYGIDVVSNGNATINGGEIVGRTTAVQVTKGTLTINGGSFDVVGEDKTWLINCIDDNYVAGTAKIAINGGQFKGFNPSDNSAEGSHTNYAKDGYIGVRNEEGYYELIKATNWIEVADTSWYVEGQTEFTLTTPEQLAGLAKLVNDGCTVFDEVTITLGNNIDLAGLVWPGIGVYKNTEKSFQGIFNGKNFTVNNMTFADNDGAEYAAEDPNNYRGLFNQIDNATVKNLTVRGNGFGETVSIGEYGGAMIVGFANNSTVENCVAEGSITGTHSVAGVVVRVRDSQIINCTNKANLTGSYSKMGGIAALVQDSETEVLFSYCVNEGTITSTARGEDGVGGIVGWIGYPNTANITVCDCENKGTITAAATATVGQIAAASWNSKHTFEYNKGIPNGILATGHSAMNGLNYAIVENGVATYIGDNDIEAGKTYLVTANDAKPVIKLNAGESITFNQSYATIDDSGITTTLKLVKTTDGDKVTYTAVAVADVNGVKYEDIDEALAEWTANGGTMKLLADISITKMITLTGKTATLDLNGKTLTTTKQLVDLGDNTDLTITDSVGSGEIISSNGRIADEVDDDHFTSLTLSNVKITSTKTSSTYMIFVDNLTMTGTTLYAPKAPPGSTSAMIRLYGESSIRNSSITVGSGTSGTLLRVETGASLEISGNTVINANTEGTALLSRGASTINGGILTGTVTITGTEGVVTVNAGDLRETNVTLKTASSKFAIKTDLATAPASVTLSESDLESYIMSDTKGADGMTTYAPELDPSKAQARIGETYYPTLADAFTASQEGDVITVCNNVDLGNGFISNIPNNVTLDLNGKTVSGKAQSVILLSSGKHLTITDSSTEKTGKIHNTSDSGDMLGVFVDKGTLTVEGGSIMSNEAGGQSDGKAVYVKNGSVVNVKGGLLQACQGIYLSKDCIANVTGGTINGTETGIISFGGTVNVIGGTVSGIGGAQAMGYEVASCGIDIRYSTGFVTVSGTAKVTGGTYGIAGNGTDIYGGTTISVRGGSITGGLAGIYHPQSGTLTVEGGSVTGSTAIYQKSGDMTISGGTITGNGEASEYTYVGSGCKPTGDAIVVDNCGYPGGAPTASITGGTFVSENSKQVGAYYHATETNGITDVAEITSTNTSLTIPEGYKWTDDSRLTKIVYVAEVNGTQYETLAEAIAAAKDGDTVTIQSDDLTVSGIDIGDKNITIDLNGFTISNKNAPRDTGVTSIFRVGDGTLTFNDTVGTGKVIAAMDFTIDEKNPYVGNDPTIISYASTDAKGSVVFNGGSFISEGDVCGWTGYLFDTYYLDNITINGGTFQHGNQTNGLFRVNSDQVITVNGGSFSTNELKGYVVFGKKLEEKDSMFNVVDGYDITNWSQVADTSWYVEGQTEFTITTAQQLAGLAKLVNEGNDFTDIIIRIGANIDLGTYTGTEGTFNNIEWTPIGGWFNHFNGILDGGNFTVSNVTVNTPGLDGVGFIGYVDSGAVIKNIKLDNIKVTGRSYTAALVGFGGGKVYDCAVTNATVDGKSYEGIITGANNGGWYINNTVDGAVANIPGAENTVIGTAVWDENGKILTGEFTQLGYVTNYNPNLDILREDAVVSKTETGWKVEKGVVIIENVYYASLQAAIDDANAGETVKLIADISGNFTVAAEKNITIDLNGKTICGAADASAIVNNGTLFITDSSNTPGAIHGNPSGEASGNNSGITNNGTLTIEKITVTGGNDALTNGHSNDDASITINSGTYIGGKYAICDYAAKGVSTINDGTFIRVGSDDTNTSSYVLSSHNGRGPATQGPGGTWTIAPGVVFQNNVSGNDKLLVCTTGEKTAVKVTLNGLWMQTEYAGKTAYVLVEENACVASIGDLGFATLQDAVNAAEAGETVKVLKDIDLSATVTVEEKITLDLNGMTITNTSSIWNSANKDWSLISVRDGELTITGNGNVRALANDCYAVDVQGGKVTINGGSYLGNWSTIYVKTGELVINGGYFDMTQLNDQGTKQHMINASDAEYKAGAAKIAINGGEFVDFNPSCNAAEGKHTDFTDGNYIGKVSNGVYTLVEGTNYDAVVTNPTCTEQGYTTHTCRVCGDSYVDTYVNAIDHNYGAPTYVWSADNITCTATRVCAHNPEHVETENATVEEKVTQAQACDKEELTTYTATFTNAAFATQTKENVKTKEALTHSYTTYVSDGNATFDQNGTKTATCDNGCGTTDTIDDEGSKITVVATIGEKKYASLAEAVADAKDSDVVILFADITIDTTLTIDENITLNLNDKKVTVNAGTGIKVAIGQVVTITGNGSVTANITAVEVSGDSVVIIENGTFTGGTQAILNRSNITIKGGTFNGNTYGLLNGVSATVNVNGGAFEGNTAAIQNNDNGTLTISDGTFNNKVSNRGVATINGGTFKNGISVYAEGKLTIAGGEFNTTATNVVDVKNAEAEITGGKFTGNLVAESGTLTLYGGTYDSEPAAAYIADGYHVAEKDEMFIVEAHSYTPVVTTPTYFAEGYTTHTCSVCGDTYTDAHVGKKDIFAGTNVDLGNSLDLNFAIRKEAISAEDVAEDKFVAVMTRTYADGRACDVLRIPSSQWEVRESVYVVTYNKIAAKQMIDSITVKIVRIEDSDESVERRDSMQSYIMRQLALTSDDALKTLYVDMLNYGAAAQQYFGYAINDLANNLLSE